MNKVYGILLMFIAGLVIIIAKETLFPATLGKICALGVASFGLFLILKREKSN